MKQLVTIFHFVFLVNAQVDERPPNQDFCAINCLGVPALLCHKMFLSYPVPDCERTPGAIDFRHQVVITHNEVRSAVATGKTLLPTAANMYNLEYDRHMEYISQVASDICDTGVLTCDKTDIRGPVGVTHFVYNPAIHKEPFSMKLVVQAWMAEASSVPVTAVGNLSEVYANNFTQLIWAKSRLVGCAMATQNTTREIFLFCTYSRKGNILGEQIYEAGPPCSGCKHCNTALQGLCGTVMEFPPVSLSLATKLFISSIILSELFLVFYIILY